MTKVKMKTPRQLVFVFTCLYEGFTPGMRTRYRSTNSTKVQRMGYPARRIRIVSIIPEQRSCLTHSSLSKSWEDKITFNYSTRRRNPNFTCFLVYRSHHTLSPVIASQWKCTHHGLLVLIRFDAADEKGLTHAQCAHQQFQRAFELTAQGRGTLSRLRPLNTRKHMQKDTRKKKVRNGGKNIKRNAANHFLTFLYPSLSFCPLPQSHLQFLNRKLCDLGRLFLTDILSSETEGMLLVYFKVTGNKRSQGELRE